MGHPGHPFLGDEPFWAVALVPDNSLVVKDANSVNSVIKERETVRERVYVRDENKCYLRIYC